MTDLIPRARAFATAKHGEKTLKSDLAVLYVTHPIAVAELLRKLRPDVDDELVAAALLHDVIEDTNTPPEDIKSQFGV